MAQSAALRKRYMPESIPLCKHCGGPMQPADFDASSGRPFYECSAALAEYQAKPDASQYHLIDSRRVVWCGDPDVLTTVDALATALAEVERLCGAIFAITKADDLDEAVMIANAALIP